MSSSSPGYRQALISRKSRPVPPIKITPLLKHERCWRKGRAVVQNNVVPASYKVVRVSQLPASQAFLSIHIFASSPKILRANLQCRPGNAQCWSLALPWACASAFCPCLAAIPFLTRHWRLNTTSEMVIVQHVIAR